MQRLPVILLAVIPAFLANAPSARAIADGSARCSFASEPMAIRSEADLLLQYREEPDRPVFAAPGLPVHQALQEFRNVIDQSFNTDPRE